MTMRSKHPAIAVVLLWLLPACVTASGSAAPSLRSDRLTTVALDSVTPREVTLRVSDARLPTLANSDSMVARLDRAMRTILKNSGIDVRDSALNTLVVDVSYPETAMKGLNVHDCVIIHGILRLRSGAMASSAAEACFVWRNLYGMRIANDAKGTYESAVNDMFKGINQSLAGMTPR